jgi:hypothetical protein
MMAGALRLLGAATVAAGVVGVARHRMDTVRVRRGDLPPATAAADLPPARPAGALAEHIATWVPAAPNSSATRALAQLWAAPLTLPGLAIALASGGQPRWSADHACWIATGVGGVSGLALRTLGADANAIGSVVLSRRERPPESLLAHEVVHVRQAERLGLGILPLYLWLAARYGYRDHPLERAARLGARRRIAAHPGPT